jgi:predicted transcriptional regulator
MRQGECSALPVAQDDRIVGLLTLENIGEWVMVKEAAGRFERRD